MKHIIRIIIIGLIFTIIDFLRDDLNVIYVIVSFITAIPISFLFDKIDEWADNVTGK